MGIHSNLKNRKRRFLKQKYQKSRQEVGGDLKRRKTFIEDAIALLQNDLGAAVDALRPIAEDPQNQAPRVHITYATGLIRIGEPFKALRHLESKIRDGRFLTEYHVAHNLYVTALIDLNQLDGAREHLLHIISMSQL
jgi:hypothetical protein